MPDLTEQEKKEKALKEIQETARNAAEKAFADRLPEFLKKELGSEESKSLIKEMSEAAIEALNIKSEDGKELALKAYIGELDRNISELEDRIKRQEDGSIVAKPSFEKELVESFKAKAEELKDMKSNKSNRVNLNLKAAGTFLLGTGQGAGIANYEGVIGLTSFDTEIAKTPRRDIFMRDLVRVIPTDNLYIAWAEKTAGSTDPNGADTVAEGEKKPQVDWKYIERTAKVEKIAVFIKVSKEALDDLSFLMAEINTDLRAEVNEVLDEQMWDGSGTSPDLNGLLNVIPAYSTGSFAGTVPFANIYDVIVTAVAQVRKARFRPTAVVVNPDDYYKLILIKDANGNYIRPQFLPDGSMTIAGVRIVENENVPTDTFVVGDFSKATLAIREDVNLDMGYENDDFTRNLVTILAELRAVFFVKENHRPAFTQGTFSTAITELTPVEPAG